MSTPRNNTGMFVALSPGTPTTGLWCDICNLPSKVEIPVNAFIGENVYKLGSADYCTEHKDER